MDLKVTIPWSMRNWKDFHWDIVFLRDGIASDRVAVSVSEEFCDSRRGLGRREHAKNGVFEAGNAGRQYPTEKSVKCEV